MPLDYNTLELLRQSHPAWRLLRSDHPSLVASFLDRVFVAPNVRGIAQADLAEALEDALFAVREQKGEAAFRKRRSNISTIGRAPKKVGCVSTIASVPTSRISI